MRIYWLSMVTTVVIMMGCEPRFIETKHEVDGYLAQGKYSSACVGLKMTHHNQDDLRGYTASKLAEYPESPVASDCLCAALYDVESGAWDAAVLNALDGSRREDLAECIAPAFSDSRVEGVPELVRLTAKMITTAGAASLVGIAQNHQDADVRASAVLGLRPSDAHVEVVLESLASDEAAVVRAAAAKALDGRHDKKDILAKLTAAAKTDAGGEVRAAAAKVLASLATRPDVRGLLCGLMMDDEDSSVRQIAVEAFKGTQDKQAVGCLEERLRTEEESGAVRQSVLDTLGSSPHERVTEVLCRNIGAYVKMYIKDKVVFDIPGADIIRAQNDRDWDQSLQCVETARNQGGYSCYGKNYLGSWVNDLGGKAHTPWCPGMLHAEDL